MKKGEISGFFLTFLHKIRSGREQLTQIRTLVVRLCRVFWDPRKKMGTPNTYDLRANVVNQAVGILLRRKNTWHYHYEQPEEQQQQE